MTKRTRRTYADAVYRTNAAIELSVWATKHGLDVGATRRAARATPSRLSAAVKSLGGVWAIPANTPTTAYTPPGTRGFASARTDGRTRWLWYGTDGEHASLLAHIEKTGCGVLSDPRLLAKTRRDAKNATTDTADISPDADTPVRVGADGLPVVVDTDGAK